MRNMLKLIATFTVIVGLTVVGCDSPDKKVADARENLRDAKEDISVAETDLYKAKQDSINEHHEFIRDSEDRISEYENKIAQLKLKISKEQGTVKNESNRRMRDLELKTNNMKEELNEFNRDKKSDLKIFKERFNRNLDELGTTISDFFSGTK